VVRALPPDDRHVVTYDVRGAGGSDAPPTTDGYRMELLVDDLVAVVDATVPDRSRVHLVGHDWGSVQLWAALAAERTDARLRGRIASFTSISGPPLDHVSRLYRSADPPLTRRLLNQSLHSWYGAAFHLALLPDLAWAGAARVVASPAWRRAHDVPAWARESARTAVNGLGLYRANMRRRNRPADPGTATDVPVLVVVPTRDRYVTPVLLEGRERRCADLTRGDVAAGHGLPRSHPRWLSGVVAAHVRAHSGGD
jgi:pimeloyl-ACP methyl ester carboxylesterase